MAVVVVNYNSSAHTASLLVSLESEMPSKVLIWDNGSNQADVLALRNIVDQRPDTNLHLSPSNLGFGTAVNAAVALLGADSFDYFWILNPDVVVRPGAMRSLVVAADRHKAGIVSPLVLMAGSDERVWFGGGRIDRQAGRSIHDHIGESRQAIRDGFAVHSFISGAAPMVHMDAWTRLKGFDESLFLYCEDAELSIRAAELGISMGLEPTAVVEHWEGGSSGARGPGETFYYYVQRNRLVLYRRYTSLPSLLVGRGLIETLRLILNPLRGPGGFRAFRASLSGLRAGLRREYGPRP